MATLREYYDGPGQPQATYSAATLQYIEKNGAIVIHHERRGGPTPGMQFDDFQTLYIPQLETPTSTGVRFGATVVYPQGSEIRVVEVARDPVVAAVEAPAVRQRLAAEGYQLPNVGVDRVVVGVRARAASAPAL